MSLQSKARETLGSAGLDRLQGDGVGPVRAATAAVIAGGAAGFAVYRLLRSENSNEEAEND
jgi:hypothetical protein